MSETLEHLNDEFQLNEIKTQLGEPYFETDNTLLYEGDCNQIMSLVEQPIFDLAVTSPPYNIGKVYENTLPLSEYISWCEKWMSQIYDTVYSSGSFWLNVGYVNVTDKGKAVPLPYLLWGKSTFYMIQEFVWNYSAGVATKRSFSPENEK